MTISNNEILQIVNTIATIATPFLLLFLGGIGWLIQNKIAASNSKQQFAEARIQELESKLREDRIDTYYALLDPFFLSFMSDAAFASDPKFKGKDKFKLAESKMLSWEYKQVGFKLSLVANDAVVVAYNDLMQFFYNAEETTSDEQLTARTWKWMELIGTLLLEIRKSMGNENSALSNWEMLEWFMTDARKMR